MNKFRLDELFDLQMGKTPSRDNQNYWNSKDNKWISIADLTKSDKYITETKEYLSDLAVKESKINIIPANTVVMSFKLSIGKTAITSEPMYSNEAIMSFRDKHLIELIPDYIYYLFSANNWDIDANKAVKGKTLNKASLSNTIIKVHDIDQQQKIVAILDQVNHLISLRTKQLEQLDLLIKSRFVEMFGTLNKPAKNYNKNILKNLCTKITDGKHGGCKLETGSNRYFVGAREIYNEEVHYDTAPEINSNEFEKDYKRCNLEIGDFLIVNTGATIGKSAIARDKRTTRTLLQKSVALLKVKKDCLNPIFLKYCYSINPQMYLVENGSAQPNLLLSRINNTEIFVPDLSEQTQFAAFVEEVEQNKTTIKQSLEWLNTLKAKLMQDYFG